MKNKILYIVDIRFKHKNLELSKYFNDEYRVLSLTPYSSFLLDEIEYLTFHDIISEENFHSNVLAHYEEYENIFQNYKHLSFLFRDIAFMITHEEYIKILLKYINNQKKENVKIHYITDAIPVEINKKIDFLKESYLFKCKSIDKIVIIDSKDKFFYQKNTIINYFNILKNKKNVVSKIIQKYIIKSKVHLSYDNTNYSVIYDNLKPRKIKNNIDLQSVNDINIILKKCLLDKSDYFTNQFTLIIDKFTNYLLNHTESEINIKPYTFLSNNKNYLGILLNKKNNIPNIFMQHGSYYHENIFLKFNEIYSADINFVFNDFTKNLFSKRGAMKVESVGSINFNYEIKEKEKKYDFVYITHCSNYSYSSVYIANMKFYLSSDANNIYTRHKEMIELFGTKFKDKKICIKIQPGIILGTMLYIPFLELSKNYQNVTIEFSIPIQNLIPKCKYIISDYFSSEFINRQLHYKRDIILFSGPPLSLPEETIEDMRKMFILVDTIDDLEEKVENIEIITKDRKRYDHIIECYSSKKCDTKKLVIEILEKELNAKT